MYFDARTGHLLACNFKKVPNRGHNYVRPGCHGYNKNGATCGSQLSKQSCGSETNHHYCNSVNRHWRSFCEDRDWDMHLSYCANVKCDEIGLDLEERENINQYNIQEILDLPNNYEFNHVSDARRKAVDETRMELSSSESEEESESGEENENSEEESEEESESEDSESEEESESEEDSESEDSEEDSASEEESEDDINFCGYCGKQRINNANFCHNCGNVF